MTRRGAIAGVLVAIATAAPGASAQSECIPAVALTGDETDELAAELERRGLAVNAESECGEVIVVASRRGDQLIVVRDGVEPEERAVPDAAAAATLIESWARSDLAAPLLATRALAAREMSAPPSEVRIVTVKSPAVPHRQLEVAAQSEIGLGRDGSTWTGVTAAACFNVNIVCVGAMLRAAVDNRTSGDSRRLAGSRYAVDTLFTVDVPFRRGSYSVYLGLGVGQGAQLAILDENGDDDDTAGVRMRARVGLAIRLTGNFSLLVDPQVVWTPGNAKIVTDSDEGPEPIIYPGDPGFHVRLGVGLMLEAL